MKQKSIFRMAVLAVLAVAWLCPQWAQAQFSGSGTGTESDPYLIYNQDQLAQVGNFLDQEGVVFELKKDGSDNWTEVTEPEEPEVKTVKRRFSRFAK